MHVSIHANAFGTVGGIESGDGTEKSVVSMKHESQRRAMATAEKGCQSALVFKAPAA